MARNKKQETTRTDSVRPLIPDSLLRPRDAATYLAVSVRTLWSLTACGQIECIRIGRAVRYHRADLDTFVARQRQGGRS